MIKREIDMKMKGCNQRKPKNPNSGSSILFSISFLFQLQASSLPDDLISIQI